LQLSDEAQAMSSRAVTRAAHRCGVAGRLTCLLAKPTEPQRKRSSGLMQELDDASVPLVDDLLDASADHPRQIECGLPAFEFARWPFLSSRDCRPVIEAQITHCTLRCRSPD